LGRHSGAEVGNYQAFYSRWRGERGGRRVQFSGSWACLTV
jgi:hypothetical protein